MKRSADGGGSRLRRERPGPFTAERSPISGLDHAAFARRADNRQPKPYSAAGARSRWGTSAEIGPGKTEPVRPEMRYPSKPSHSLAAISSR